MRETRNPNPEARGQRPEARGKGLLRCFDLRTFTLQKHSQKVRLNRLRKRSKIDTCLIDAPGSWQLLANV